MLQYNAFAKIEKTYDKNTCQLKKLFHICTFFKNKIFIHK